MVRKGTEYNRYFEAVRIRLCSSCVIVQNEGTVRELNRRIIQSYLGSIIYKTVLDDHSVLTYGDLDDAIGRTARVLAEKYKLEVR